MPRPSTPTALCWLQTDGLEQPPSNILSCSVIYKAGLPAGLILAEEDELPTNKHDPTRVRDASDGPSRTGRPWYTCHKVLGVPMSPKLLNWDHQQSSP